MMSKQEAKSGGEVAGCTSFAISIVIVVVAMIVIGNTVGFNGFLSVAGWLIVSLIAGFVFFAICALIFGPDSGEQAKTDGRSRTAPPDSTRRAQSHRTAANSNPLVGRIRLYDRDLSRKLKAFQKAAAERPEFTLEGEQSVLNKVKEMDAHHESYKHILNDDGHPDHAVVTREMRRYRSTIADLVQLRTKDLQTGRYGGFDYRESLRDVEGEVELLSDEFQILSAELETDRGRRGEPEETP